jgi:hypothetical protein
MPSNTGRRSQKAIREEQQLMGGIIDEMIRGYAKGYLFGRMVVGCFFVLLLAVVLGALLVLLLTLTCKEAIKGHVAEMKPKSEVRIAAHRFAGMGEQSLEAKDPPAK